MDQRTSPKEYEMAGMPPFHIPAIIYGLDRPKISFQQSPKGGILFQIENEKVIYCGEEETITWGQVFALPDKVGADYKAWDWLHYNFWKGIEELTELTQSEPEKKFFRDYVEASWADAKYSRKPVTSQPALLPQVWVNWLHYDSKDKTRAEIAKREPFRVDFMVKDSDISSSFVIFEIDGSGHFGKYKKDATGEPKLRASMDQYTQHIRKDRWLRQQGFEVIRMSSQEVMDYESSRFIHFYFELTGEYKFVGSELIQGPTPEGRERTKKMFWTDGYRPPDFEKYAHKDLEDELGENGA